MAHPYEEAPALPETGALRVDEILPGTGPADLEIGCGRADFLISWAAHQPDRRILGLEIRKKWVVVGMRNLRARGLHRARLYAADAHRVVPRLEGQEVFETIFVHFPDPWWKRRHEHRLVLCAALLDHYVRLLRTGGQLFVQTDVPNRAESYRALLAGRTDLISEHPGHEFLDPNPLGVTSHREKKCMAAGLPIYRLCYRKA